MKKSVKKNYVYNVIYQIALFIVPIIVTPYVSKVLDPEGIGQYSFSFALISYFVLFGSLGFGYYAQREIARYQDDGYMQSKTFWEIILCRFVSVIASLTVNVILILFGVYGDNTILMSILCVNILSCGLDISFYFRGNEEFGKIVLRSIVIKFLGTAGIFLFVKDQNDVWIYTLLHSLILIVSDLSLWPMLINKVCKVSLKELKPMSHFKGTLKLFIPAVSVSIYRLLDKSLIGFITESDAENGYYEQADKIVRMALTVITCLGTVMIPRNASEFSKGNIKNIEDNVYKSCHFVWLIGIPMTVGLFCISVNVVPWFLGENFYPSINLMKIFSFLILIIGLSNVFGLQYLIPTKQDNKFTMCLIIGAAINVVLNLLLIFNFKAAGAAIASVIAELAITLSMIIVLRKKLSLKKIMKSCLKPLMASLFMFLVIYPISEKLTPSFINTILIIGIGVVTYSISVLILRDSLVSNFMIKVIKRNK